MDKKNILFSLLSATIILAVVVGVCYSTINKSDAISPITGSISTDCIGCSIEKGSEKYVSAIKPAVESFLNQNSDESASDRNKRLSLYFAGDSPVYDYSQENISSSVNKSSAEIVSIKSSPSESEHINFIVKVKVALYSGDKTSTKTQDYWISLSRIYDESLIAQDIGVMKW